MPKSTAGTDVRTPCGRNIQVKALRYTAPSRNSVGSFTRAIEFDELAIVCFEYEMRVREALLIDSAMLRVPSDGRPGLLTPAGMRLTLGPRAREAAEVISAEQLWAPRAGTSRDRALVAERR